jgi:hypothetical protein
MSTNTHRPEGISGWQAMAVIAACVAVMVATFFISPS